MAPTATPTAAQQEEYLRRVREQIQQQTIQELIGKLNEKCFKICAGKRGVHLDQKEQGCLVNCMDRYMDTMASVQQSIAARQTR